MNYCIYGAASDAIDPNFLQAGEALGRALGARGHGLVFGGGAAGMMGAAARGIRQMGDGEIIGVAPHFFHVDGVLFPDCTKMIYTDTMRERKQKMEELSDGFIVTPGGVGTMDEFFEILTLRQLGRHGKPIAILNTDGYYDPLDAMLTRMAEGRFMREASLNLFRFFAEPEPLVDWLEKQDERYVDLKETRIANWTLKDKPKE